MGGSRFLPRAAIAAGIAVVAVSACAMAEGGFGGPDDDKNRGKPANAPTRAPSLASAYPEAALVEMWSSGSAYADYSCSGAVIAPRVVLTAAHCIVAMVKWRVSVPFSGGQTVTATTAKAADGGAAGESENGHD